MSLNDDLVQPSSDSFWEIGKYMRTVKRCDNGYKLCDQLKALVESRSDIEKSYAKNLAQWSKKWNDFLDKGPEYGTTQGSWRSVLTEADNVCDIHNEIAERLMSEVHQSIKHWQKENYHKSMMHFKETKELEDGFRKAQKPWGKKLGKVMAARKEYHTACRTEKSTANQENNARGDATVSPDQLKKLQEKLRKLTNDVEATREKYQAAVNDLNSYNAKYIEDTTEVFEKAQEFERKRIEFIKKTAFQIHNCLDISNDARFKKVYTDLYSAIGNNDADKDLKWWSANNGADMPMAWPTFEEYSPDLQSISKRAKSQIVTGDGITITSIRHQRDSSYDSTGGGRNSKSYDQQHSQEAQPTPSTYTSSSSTHYTDICNYFHSSYSEEAAGNPFGDDFDEQEAEDEPPVSGWTVEAMYAYEATEDDELSFDVGEVFLQVEAKDEMGWCKGRLSNGKEGFFPANYVQRK
ncbi:hypothetical protein LOTGIDRAFT_208680 [Lottia gigantea]|uniref:F-BAR domain-containing protein n=1 Tax=Lottia gigantea TaxID=225164 RepID=V4AUP1_LOTGI|nr:hypothetical protein LOTGIDRAFT_208680 [Lottia gigantea]ESO97496.1 hypothetical protein LOTGIDRAFT_208680 [Lottia gigantea]